MATVTKPDTMTWTMKTALSAADKKAGVRTETACTVTLDDDKALRDFAERGMRVAIQALMRAEGKISPTYAITVSDLNKRSASPFKATPESLANKIRKMPEAEYRATLANLGINAKDIERMVKANTASITK